jgi:hypothetical protein
MTTVAHVRQAVKPLLQRNPDLALVGRMIVVKPVHHVLRAVYADRSLDPKMFSLKLFAICMCSPDADIYFNYSQDCGWFENGPDAPDMMVDEVEKRALPLLRSMVTIEDYQYFATHLAALGMLEYDLYRKFFVELGRGAFDAARTTLERARTENPTHNGRYALGSYAIDVVAPLLLADNRPAIADILHGHEAAGAERMKLGKLWERTPFPFELP